MKYVLLATTLLIGMGMVSTASAMTPLTDSQMDSVFAGRLTKTPIRGQYLSKTPISGTPLGVTPISSGGPLGITPISGN